MGNGIGLVLEGDLYGADFCYRELPDVLDPFDRETYGLYRREHLALTEYEAGNGT